MSGDEILPGLVVHKSHVPSLDWTVTHAGSGMFVLHTVPTKSMAVELAQGLGQYNWTLTADQLRAYPSLHVAVLEAQMAISAERVRRDGKTKAKVQAKAAEKRAQPDGWDEWKRQMNLRQAKSAAEKARRKKWAKKRKSQR